MPDAITAESCVGNPDQWAALWVVEAVSSLEQGIEKAARSIDGGAARARLDALCEATARAKDEAAAHGTALAESRISAAGRAGRA